MITETITRYTRDEVYSYREAAEIIGVRFDTIGDAARHGDLTSVRISGGGQYKYVPRYEIDILAGSGRVTSRESRLLVEQARAENGINVHPQSAKGQLLVDEETQYGDQFTMTPELPSQPKSNDILSIIAIFADGQSKLSRWIDTILSSEQMPRSRQ